MNARKVYTCSIFSINYFQSHHRVSFLRTYFYFKTLLKVLLQKHATGTVLRSYLLYHNIICFIVYNSTRQGKQPTSSDSLDSLRREEELDEVAWGKNTENLLHFRASPEIKFRRVPGSCYITVRADRSLQSSHERDSYLIGEFYLPKS